MKTQLRIVIMLKSKDVEFQHMYTVAHEMNLSFRHNTHQWTMELLEELHKDSEYKLDHYLLVLKHEDSNTQYLISYHPLHFHVDMDMVFDIVDVESGNRKNIQVFSHTQKEMMYKEFIRNFNPVEFISKEAKERYIQLRPFKNEEQKAVYDQFMKGTETKYTMNFMDNASLIT